MIPPARGSRCGRKPQWWWIHVHDFGVIVGPFASHSKMREAAEDFPERSRYVCSDDYESPRPMTSQFTPEEAKLLAVHLKNKQREKCSPSTSML